MATIQGSTTMNTYTKWEKLDRRLKKKKRPGTLVCVCAHARTRVYVGGANKQYAVKMLQNYIQKVHKIFYIEQQKFCYWGKSMCFRLTQECWFWICSHKYSSKPGFYIMHMHIIRVSKEKNDTIRLNRIY